jgi:outer membrane protein OmpA-like peptidoglycan-associated protein
MLAIFRKRPSELLFFMTIPPMFGSELKDTLRNRPYSYKPAAQRKVAFRRSPDSPADGPIEWAWSHMTLGMLFILLVYPSDSLGAWPWSKPDQVTAECVIEPAQVEQGSSQRLQARMEASDTRKHALAYVWSSNGGQILGSGARVEIDIAKLNPGVYSLAGVAQDAYRNQGTCTARFQVIAPANPILARCLAEPQEVPQGKMARLRAEASDRLGQSLRYAWFANGGQIQPQGAEALFPTDGLRPGDYTITTRIEDDLGHATDCMAIVKVIPPPLPPELPEPKNIAQIVFPRNASLLGDAGRLLLQNVLERLEGDAAGRISLESYAAPDESRPQELAAARAETVRRFLMDHGITESRVQTVVGIGGRLGGVRNLTLDVIWIPDGVEY